MKPRLGDAMYIAVRDRHVLLELRRFCARSDQELHLESDRRILHFIRTLLFISIAQDAER